jgi:hypothetical protein
MDLAWRMIEADISNMTVLCNAIHGDRGLFMKVEYKGKEEGSDTLVWDLKNVNGGHCEYRLLEGVDAPICVLKDLKRPERNLAVELAGSERDVQFTLAKAVCALYREHC